MNYGVASFLFGLSLHVIPKRTTYIALLSPCGRDPLIEPHSCHLLPHYMLIPIQKDELIFNNIMCLAHNMIWLGDLLRILNLDHLYDQQTKAPNNEEDII